MAWEPAYFENLIHSMKYQIFFNNVAFDENQKNILNVRKYNIYYLLGNCLKLKECNDFIYEFVDEFNAPHSLEYEYSKKYQMYYLTELIETVYKLSLVKKCI